MRARTYLIRIQRAMYRRLKSYARLFLGRLSPELKKYYLEYQRDFNDFEAISSKHELLRAIENAQIVFCGDYHTLSQAQRTVIRLLREVVPIIKEKGRRIVLALEMVRASDDSKIARFLAGELSEAEFLESIAFHKRWGFSWENYRKLFEFAKIHQLEVIGINLDGKRYPTLRQRDRFAARCLADHMRRDPKATFVVLVGDLHLATSHLPKQLEIQLKRREISRRQVVIHQNSERFYWKLVDKGLEQLVDVVRVKKNLYCVMNTPPWVKLQSHLKWAELIAEGARDVAVRPQNFPPREGVFQGEVFDTVDHHQEIYELLSAISQFLAIKAPVDDRFQICGPIDLSFVERLETEYRLSRLEARVTARALAVFESHFIPRANVIFLSSLSLNHAATQSSLYLHSRLSGFDRIFTRPREDFYSYLWVEALGFLGSKVINHKRKCNGRSDLERLLKGKKARGAKKDENIWVAQSVLAHLEAEEKFFHSGKNFHGIFLPERVLNENKIVAYYKVAKLLGQLLGNALYLAVVENQIAREDLRRFFESRFDDPIRTQKLYLTWAKRLDKQHFRDVTKMELL